MKKFFITSVGTGIGKTFITAALCRQLKESGKNVAAFKPVISGYDDRDDETKKNSDSAVILKSLGLIFDDKNINMVSPYRFVAPLSPNMAAEKEGKRIEVKDLVEFCRQKESMDADVILVEGVGGVMVPLNESSTVMDWIKELSGWKIILVAGSYLGSISHCLTALRGLQSVGINTDYLIINESKNSEVDLKDTVSTISNFISVKTSIITISYQRGYAVNPQEIIQLNGILS
ncbi:MAG: dethiobiotin synthase [Rickettsiales bacterium]